MSPSGRIMASREKRNAIVTITFGTVILAVVVLLVVNDISQRRIERIFNDHILMQLDEGDYPVEETTLLGTKLQYHKDIEDYGILHQLRTAGPDEKFGTNDDNIVQSKVDLNKSRMLGNYLGQKSKEFIKGWWDGRKQESEFDKDGEKTPSN